MSKSDIIIQVEQSNITFVQKILESYENHAYLFHIDTKKGLLKIHTTPYLYEEVMKIIENLPIQVKIINHLDEDDA